MNKSFDTQTNAKTAAIAEGHSFFLCAQAGQLKLKATIQNKKI